MINQKEVGRLLSELWLATSYPADNPNVTVPRKSIDYLVETVRELMVKNSEMGAEISRLVEEKHLDD